MPKRSRDDARIEKIDEELSSHIAWSYESIHAIILILRNISARNPDPVLERLLPHLENLYEAHSNQNIDGAIINDSNSDNEDPDAATATADVNAAVDSAAARAVERWFCRVSVDPPARRGHHGGSPSSPCG